MDHRVILGFDVGASYTRVGVGLGTGEGVIRHPDCTETLTRPVRSKAELRSMVNETLERLGENQPPRSIVLAFAGPIENQSRVRITNWQEPRELKLEELVAWGMPAQGTRMVNDMDAACTGLVEQIKTHGRAPNRFQVLSPDPQRNPRGNMVLVVPGTGLGTAAILQVEVSPGEPIPVPLSCESQHTPMPAFDAEHAAILGWLREARGVAGSWEDLISGRGLLNAYHGFCHLRRCEPRTGVDAAAIAEAGRTRADLRAREALDFFYRGLGRWCQLMALTFQAHGGVFLGGASTRSNRDVLTGSALVTEFLHNEKQRHLLRRFPVSLILDDVHVDGALALAASALDQDRY